MNISSDKKQKKAFDWKWIKAVKENPYIMTSWLVVIIATIMNFTITDSWGIGILVFVVAGIGLTIFLNTKLGYYNPLNMKYYFIMVFFFVFISSPSHIMPMMNDYQTAERIDEVLVLDKETKLYYNDANDIFILFLDGEKQPLVIDKGGSSETYNRLKADYLDNKIKVERKRVKSWYDDEVVEGYYLDGYKFD